MPRGGAQGQAGEDEIAEPRRVHRQQGSTQRRHRPGVAVQGAARRQQHACVEQHKHRIRRQRAQQPGAVVATRRKRRHYEHPGRPKQVHAIHPRRLPLRQPRGNLRTGGGTKPCGKPEAHQRRSVWVSGFCHCRARLRAAACGTIGVSGLMHAPGDCCDAIAHRGCNSPAQAQARHARFAYARKACRSRVAEEPPAWPPAALAH